MKESVVGRWDGARAAKTRVASSRCVLVAASGSKRWSAMGPAVKAKYWATVPLCGGWVEEVSDILADIVLPSLRAVQPRAFACVCLSHGIGTSWASRDSQAKQSHQISRPRLVGYPRRLVRIFDGDG